MAIIDRSFQVGTGRAGFLLIHGLGGTPIELKFVAKGLARHGFRAYCCQLAGHCGTEKDLVSTGWHDWYASVEQAFERLKNECDTVVVGGLSMGAVLALHLAAKRPGEVHGLALYAPTLWYDGWALPWYRFMLRFGMATALGRWIIRTFYRFTEKEPYGIKDPAIRAVVIAAMNSGDTTQAGILVTPGQAVAELNDLVEAVKRELRSITTPALIVQAREDDLSSLRNAEYLQRHLGGLVDTLVLDDSYHIVTVDRQRDLLIESTVAFATLLVERLKLVQLGDQTVRAISDAHPASAAQGRLPQSASGHKLP
jgi:carboxylesterase